MAHTSPLACDLTALDPAQRERRGALAARLTAAREEVRELPDGYAFRFASDPSTCLAVMEFVTLERRCCPFLDFVLDVEREGGPLWLRLTGREGVKPFLEASGMVKAQRA
jgi:hypothetical protein